MSGSLFAQFINVFMPILPNEYKKNLHFTPSRDGDKLEGWNPTTQAWEYHTEDEWDEIGDKSVVSFTGNKEGELIEGWNPITQKKELNSKEEWANIEKRRGPKMDTKKAEMEHLEGMDLSGLEVPEFDEHGAPTGKTKKVDMGDFTLKAPVHVQSKDETFGKGLEEQQLVVERFAFKQMRAKMTDTINKRFDTKDVHYSETAKQGMVNHCAMAQGLTSLLKKDGDFDPADLFKSFEVDDQKGGKKKEGGLLSRIVGSTEGQGGFAKPTPEEVMKQIMESADRLKAGRGTGDDGNKITQFLAAFVDGLTEVIEGSSTGGKQFEQIWPKFATAFGLKDGDKKKLLERIEGYKKLAGGMSDTLSGKGTRKGVVRGGSMPTDERYKIEEEDALIKGDISGSMHSQLLAQELSTTLFDTKGPKIKDQGESVQLVDTGLLNARAHDALMLTAGGKDVEGDSVFHTAFEMINGMQKITGCPRVSQKQASDIMVMLRGGMTFTEAMEEIFPSNDDGKLPWRA
jgi:hypothetical protein